MVPSLFGGREVGGVKSTGVSQSVRETSTDESQCVPSQEKKKTLPNKGFGAPKFWGISPKFAALCGIYLGKYTGVLQEGCWGREK